MICLIWVCTAEVWARKQRHQETKPLNYRFIAQLVKILAKPCNKHITLLIHFRHKSFLLLDEIQTIFRGGLDF